MNPQHYRNRRRGPLLDRTTGHPVGAVSAPSQVFACAQCGGREFMSAHALKVHIARVHAK